MGELVHDAMQREQQQPRSVAGVARKELPSVGSAYHGFGQCKPCAWFYRPGGCLNGQACAHCHLCPKGEIKARKKAKEAAMSAGLLPPQRIDVIEARRYF